jgi:hypothetical protein
MIEIRGRRARAGRELCKNTHVPIFELIEEFDSNSWFVLFSVCDVDDMLMNVFFLLYIFFYMLCI